MVKLESYKYENTFWKQLLGSFGIPFLTQLLNKNISVKVRMNFVKGIIPITLCSLMGNLEEISAEIKILCDNISNEVSK